MLGPRSNTPPGGATDVPFAGLPAGPDARLTWAPAKVNLFLEVLGKRPDGYHEVETLILAVDLFDTLEVRDDRVGKTVPGVRPARTARRARTTWCIRPPTPCGVPPDSSRGAASG